MLLTDASEHSSFQGSQKHIKDHENRKELRFRMFVDAILLTDCCLSAELSAAVPGDGSDSLPI